MMIMKQTLSMTALSLSMSVFAIANQLLNTARTDTVTGYNAAIYGRGEASLTRALAPASIR